MSKRGFDLLDLAAVFDDPKRIDFADERIDYGEARRLTIGKSDGRFFTVVYTIRGDITWLITAWPSSRKERAPMADPITFMHLSDGTILQRQADGSYRPVEGQTDWDRIDRLTEEEIEEWARSDPDHPGTDDEFWKMVDAQKPDKQAISIKLDKDLLDFFKAQGRGYQTRINAVLRHYMDRMKKAG